MTTTGHAPAAGPPFDDLAKIEAWAQRQVKELMSVEHEPLTADEKLLHQPFLFLLMKLVHASWNGNRRGVMGTYYHRDKQRTLGKMVWNEGKQYLGHNIAAIAVDGENNVIDFDFNHNDIFRSTVEHAEARLIRRLFNLTGIRSEWSLGDRYGEEEPDRERNQSQYATTLSAVTIYTTLEPCAQCTGIMALAGIKRVVYLQRDDGAMRVANIVYNLRPYSAGARPIDAKECGVLQGLDLTQAFDRYKQTVMTGDPFFVAHGPNPTPDRSTSLATFLCTDYAMDIFAEGAQKFDDIINAYRTESPNVKVEELKQFLDYAMQGGHRGTPH